MSIQAAHYTIAAPCVDNLMALDAFSPKLANGEELARRTAIKHLLSRSLSQFVMIVAVGGGKDKMAIRTGNWLLPLDGLTWSSWPIAHTQVANNTAAHPMGPSACGPFTIHTKLMHIQQLLHSANIVEVLALQIQTKIESK
jgi:hypothetical protein